jgi:hypothetical protein
MPSALGEKLHLQDRELLSAPLRVDEADLFPLDQDPMYITQPPVPSLGGEGVERYAEGTGRRFRRMPAQADGEQLATAASAEHSGATYVPPPPSGGTQAAFTFFGLMYHASGGMLAGVTLAQSICSPGFDCDNLVLHMAYASVALTLQRAVTTLSLLAFIGTADRHVCRRVRPGTRSAVPPVRCAACARASARASACASAHSSNRAQLDAPAPSARCASPAAHPAPPYSPCCPPPAAPAAPCRRTHLSGLTLFLTGLYVVLVALQLPPDAAFHHGRWRPTPTPRYPPTPIHP